MDKKPSVRVAYPVDIGDAQRKPAARSDLGHEACRSSKSRRQGGIMNKGSESEEPISAPQTAAPAPVRLAVFKETGEEKRHLSTVTLKMAKGMAWALEATGPSADELRPLFERFIEARRSLANNAVVLLTKTPADALADMLTADDFTVERLPAGDHQINFQIDLKTGKVVGTHAAMHPLAASDEGMGRRVF
jgi:hypothetical protein